MAIKKKKKPEETTEQMEPQETPIEEREEQVEENPEVTEEEPQEEPQDIGRFGPVTTEVVLEAESTLKKYKDGKASVEARIIENEKWWRLRHWEVITQKQTDQTKKFDPQPTSAWLFNSIANKHADAMDNYPQPNILPREENDKQDAQLLTSIIPIILERNGFEEVYSDRWWYKLKTGSGAYGVFWDNSIDNGLGDVSVKGIDILNLFWEPGIRNIQDSRNVFHIDLVDNDILEEQYPFLMDKLGGGNIDKAEYSQDDTIDTSEKSIVVDWYYKVGSGKSTILHYCKFCGGEVIYASENDPAYAERGYYDHGKYPFIIDTLFPIETSLIGFGYIDVMKDPQMYIDKLDQIINKNAMMAGKKRFFKKNNCGVNVEEFADWSKDFVEVEGNLSDENLREIEVSPLPNFIINHKQMKIDELKETSGNRDFSQGSTQSGVTAASAIAALQEAGSKLSRDMIKSSYRAFTELNYLVLELIRQFYDEPRSFRLDGDGGEYDFETYDNTGIKETPVPEHMTGEVGARRPVFDIKISAEKKSPFIREAQNQMAKEMYGMGWFNPQAADQALIAIDMMEFEGKEAVKAKIQGNAQLFEMNQRMMQVIMQADAMLGTNLAMQAGLIAPGAEPPMPAAGTVPDKPSNDTENTIATKARNRAATASTPKG